MEYGYTKNMQYTSVLHYSSFHVIPPRKWMPPHPNVRVRLSPWPWPIPIGKGRDTEITEPRCRGQRDVDATGGNGWQRVASSKFGPLDSPWFSPHVEIHPLRVEMGSNIFRYSSNLVRMGLHSTLDIFVLLLQVFEVRDSYLLHGPHLHWVVRKWCKKGQPIAEARKKQHL